MIRRFETWLIIAAVVVCLVISCSGCARSDPMPGKSPTPSRKISEFRIPVGGNNVAVSEFRDSAGRVCVIASFDYKISLDCGSPLPPLQYNDLPHVEGEQQ